MQKPLKPGYTSLHEREMCPGGSSSPTWGTEQFKASLNNLVRVCLKIDYMFRKECLGVQFSGRALFSLLGALGLILGTPRKGMKRKKTYIIS